MNGHILLGAVMVMDWKSAGCACAGINPAGCEPLLPYQFLCCSEMSQNSPLDPEAMLLSLFWLSHVTVEHALAFLSVVGVFGFCF